MGAHAEVARRGGHGSALAQGVPSWQSQLPTMAIDSLQPGHEWSPSGSSPDWTDLFRDQPAYRIGPLKAHRVAS